MRGTHSTTLRLAVLSATGLAFAALTGACGGETPHHADAPTRAPTERDVISTAAATSTTSATSADNVPPHGGGSSVAAAVVPSSAPPGRDAPPRVVDLHVDTPWQVHFKGRSLDLPEGHATMAALRAGRYAAITYPIYIADHLHDGRPTIADADAILGTIEELIRRHPDVLWDPRRGGSAPAGAIEALLSIEGAGAFADDPAQIDRFIARGVRFVGPVHAADNRLASSATGKKPGYGLTDVGKTLCRRVYAAGALVDVSHMSDAAFDDLVPIAAEVGAPIVATHSNARAVADHPRNLTDQQLRTIARSGGVAGLNLHGAFLRRGATPTLADAVEQALHMVAIAGPEHVAIGSDFDGASPPADLADASQMPRLAEELEKAGLTREQVRAVFEGNARRVLGWRPSARR